MSDWTVAGTLALGCIVALYLWRRALWGHSNPLPPGPPGLPWVGNVIGVNIDAPWLTYAKWSRTYGDLLYSKLFGKHIIIINSEKVARDLLEKRSINYSDRPYFITNELCGVDFNTVLLAYGDRWRSHRRFFHQTFQLEAVARFQPYQHRRACHLLQRLLNDPEQLKDHLFEFTAAVSLNSTYNYDPASPKDELVDMVVNVLRIAESVVRPHVAIIIGAFPWILCLPSWFPGMAFKSQMAIARKYTAQYLQWPIQYSLEKPSGSVAPSMVHDALRFMEENGIQCTPSLMNDLKDAAGTAFFAASETSNSVLMTFFLMMLLHPEVQDKAHAQILTTVGQDRLPAMHDRPSLPFIDAIFRETLRYYPVVPLSIPHATVDDDIYDGFHIPKGAIVLANLWSMARDESRFPDPHLFIPERFLHSDGSLKPAEIEHLSFGFGRRICSGRYFADTTIWVAIANILAVFKIMKALDENGVEIQVEEKFSRGVVVQPLPFKCRIVPRYPGMDSEKLERLIAASVP